MIIYFSDGSGLGRSGRDVAQTELAQPIALRPRRADSAISRHLTGQNCSVSPPIWLISPSKLAQFLTKYFLDLATA